MSAAWGPFGGWRIVDILEALGLRGPRLFLVSLLIAIVITWLSWKLAYRGMRGRRRTE